MDAVVELICSNPTCGRNFTRLAKEHRRGVKQQQTGFYCTQSCQVSWKNHLTPRGPSAHLVADNLRDEFTPFRWFILRARARKKRGSTNLTLPYLQRIWVEQKGVCPLTGWALRLPTSVNGWPGGSTPESASLDRIDNTRGYVEGNVRFVAVMANFAKHTFSDEDVRRFASAVYHHSQEI